jgi:hypothetical protein
MREGRVNWVNDFLMQTKSMTSWAGTNNLVFVAATNAHNILRKQSKEVFNVQVALHFPNSLPTVRLPVLYSVNPPCPPPEDGMNSSVGLSHGNLNNV